VADRLATDRKGSSVTQAPPRSFPALTGLRAVAAVWVVLYHAFMPLYISYGRPMQLLGPVLHSGWLGVDLFFVLSGFVITHSYLDRLGHRLSVADAGRFLWARVARVWPVWAVVSTAFAGILVLAGDPGRPDSYSAPVTFANSVRQLFMVQTWSSETLARTSYVVPGWSLSAEWLAYCCFPLLALVLFRLRRAPWWLLAAGSLLALVPFAAVCLRQGDVQDLWTLRIAGGFVSGALMNLAVRRLRDTPVVQRLATGAAVLSLAAVPAVFLWSALLWDVPRCGVVVLVFPVLVAALALSQRGPAAVLALPLLQLGGRISYSLYLVHTCAYFVFEVIARQSVVLVPGGRAYGLLFPLVVLSTLPLAWLLWRFVEEPAQRRLMSLLPSRGRTVPGIPVPRAAEPIVGAWPEVARSVAR
jgi:peptidoglycan/LPS O-acetylase OafA/YrhL